MPETRDSTVELLRRWHAGDRAALEILLARHIEPLHRHVEAHLRRDFGQLRREVDSMDLVQSAALRVLEYTPPFIPASGRQFQQLLRKIVLNELLSQLRAPRNRHRAPSTDTFGASVLDLRAPAQGAAGPDLAAQRAEQQQLARAWTRLGLEFLDDEADRRLMLMAAVEERGWEDIGAELGISPNAARMRFQRLLPRVANRIRMLQEGRVEEMLDPDS